MNENKQGEGLRQADAAGKVWGISVFRWRSQEESYELDLGCVAFQGLRHS